MYNILHLASGPGPADARRPRPKPPLPEPEPRARPAPADVQPMVRADEPRQAERSARPAMDC
jgi:hypothetical protein